MDKWEELRFWLANYAAGENLRTAKNVFDAALRKMNELEETEKRLNPVTKKGGEEDQK